MSQLIQFMHPGSERPMPKQGDLDWNHDEHGRVFMVGSGRDASAHNATANEALHFWGEWEARASVQPLRKLGKSLPSAVVRPLHSPCPTGGRPHNTDPFVFGPHFLYSCCKQVRGSGPTYLRELARGDVVLFGSQVDARFVLDTVFVVAGSQLYPAARAADALRDRVHATVLEAVLEPIQHPYRQPTVGRAAPPRNRAAPDEEFTERDEATCNAPPTCGAPGVEYRLYEGATPTNPVNGMFSFVPARRASEGAFARPALSGVGTNDALRMGSRRIALERPLTDYWHLICDQLRKQGFVLAVDLQYPPSM